VKGNKLILVQDKQLMDKINYITVLNLTVDTSVILLVSYQVNFYVNYYCSSRTLILLQILFLLFRKVLILI